MQHRLIMALAALLYMGCLSGTLARPPDKQGDNAARPILTAYYIPFGAETIVGITPTTIRGVPPIVVTSAAVAADVSRCLDARAGSGKFSLYSTHLLIVFADGRPDVLVDQFRDVSSGKRQYKLRPAEYDQLDTLFRGMQDAREAAEARAVEDAKPALIKAVERNDPGMVRQLLKDGAAPDARDHWGMNALMHAAESDNSDLCEILVSGGTDVNLEDPRQETALSHAIIDGRLGTSRWLLAHGADVKGRRGANAFLDAVSAMSPEAAKSQKEIIAALLARDVPVEARDQVVGMTPLMWAMGQNTPALVEEIIRRGGDVNANSSDQGGNTPLIWAAITGDDAAVRLLLAHGAALNWKGCDGITALTMAATDDHLSTVRLLLSYGATCDALTLERAAAHRPILRLLKAHTHRKRQARR